MYSTYIILQSTYESKGKNLTICDNYAVFKVFISKCKSKIFAELLIIE